MAALLVRSHGSQLSPALSAAPSVAPMQNFLSHASNDQQLQRYLPEAIAKTIRDNPEAVAPFVPSVEGLLDDANPDVRFGAACALAKYKGVGDPKILAEFTAGLKSKETLRPYPEKPVNAAGLKQLMAIETLQRLGQDAKPLIPALLEYANSTRDSIMRKHAFAAVGYIDSNLRNTMPEVDQAVKDDRVFKSPSM